jgi:uncharacterized iron-regulated protein
MRRVSAILVLVGLACATSHGNPWVTELYEGHPLVGRIWDVNAESFVDPATLADRAAESRYVLLGEKHDNPDHHLLQARMIRELVARGRRPAVALEMISLDRSDALAAQLAEHPKDVDALAQAVEWEKSGWLAWDYYRPIAEAALENDLPFVAANLPIGAVKAMRRLPSAPPRDGKQPDSVQTAGVPADVREILTEEIQAGHCGHAPERMVQLLVEIQHARDAQLARVLEVAGEEDGAVLIAGNGHVRKWLAVPRFLEAEPPFVLAFTEVRADVIDPAEYTRGGVFDAVWFTPRVDDVDPCEQFRERLKERFEKRGE